MKGGGSDILTLELNLWDIVCILARALGSYCGNASTFGNLAISKSTGFGAGTFLKCPT